MGDLVLLESIISRISSSILRQVMALIRKAYQEYERIRSKGKLRLELELSSGFILTWSRCAPGI